MSGITSEVAFEELPNEPASDPGQPPGVGPYQLAWRRLRRNRVSMFFGGLFILLVILCLLAPVYSNDIAHIGPNVGNQTGTVHIGGKAVPIISINDIPIGPTWNVSHYFLGADNQGRDVAVRVLYGGRTSMEIGLIATVLTMVLGTLLGLISGFYRGITDTIISRIMDIVWAFPVVLIGIVIGVVLITKGIGPFHSTSPLSVGLLCGFVYIPYVVRPMRAQVLTLREREFVDAARQQGRSNLSIMLSELMPNLSSEIIVFIPLIFANAVLLEAALSYLGAGVQPPASTWGTMLEGALAQGLPLGSFHTVLVPGLMLVLTVLSVNIFGDGLRDALDPKAKVKA